ncbi:unnamed protein product [Closterium sp. NIES-53]
MVERESGKRVKAIRSDRGGEFLGAEFWSWLKRHGIKKQLTTAYTPQSNGVAERANRTIIEGGRTILVDSGLPLRFWPLAIRHATVIKNQVLTHVGGQHWVPMEKWSGKKPLVDMLRVFGCMGLVHVPKEKRDKLQAAAVWAVHLGLARGSKGWLMWDPKSNTIFTTRDAKFMEGLMFKEWSERGRSKVTIPLGIEVGTNDPLLIPIELSSSSELTEVSHDLGGAEGEAADVEEVLQQGEALIAERGKRDAVRGGAKEGAAKERPKRAAHPRDFLKYERLGVPKALLVQEEEYEEEKGAEGEMEQICCFGVNLPHEPASMEEALAGDDGEAWLASREDEFQSHMENETWTLTNLPPGRKALDCTWVLRVKTDAEGRLERRKTRLVIKGFQQREGIDFQEVFAPVAKAPTLWLLLAAAAVCGWKVEQMDVKTAFLYGVVDVTEVAKTVESITGDLEHRYLDTNASFGGSGNGWLPKFLTLYGKRSGQTVKVRGTDAEGHPINHSYIQHERKMKGHIFKSCNKDCVRLCRKFAKDCVDRLLLRLDDLRGMGPTKLFHASKWPKSKHARERKCQDWLTGCSALFKNKLPGFDQRKASLELATWCPIMESHHEEESFAQGMSNFMGSGDARSEAALEEEFVESEDEGDEREMDQEIEQSPPRDYSDEEEDNPFLFNGEEEGEESYHIDKPLH